MPFARSMISVVKRSRSTSDIRCSLFPQPAQPQAPDAAGKWRMAMRGFFSFSSFDSFFAASAAVGARRRRPAIAATNVLKRM